MFCERISAAGPYKGRLLIIFRNSEGDLQIVRMLHQTMDTARHIVPRT